MDHDSVHVLCVFLCLFFDHKTLAAQYWSLNHRKGVTTSNSKPFFCVSLPVLEPGVLIVVQTPVFYKCMLILEHVLVTTETKQAWLISTTPPPPTPFGAVGSRCCSPAYLHVSFSTGALVTHPRHWRSSTTRKYMVFLKAWRVCLFSLVFLWWSDIKMNNLEWICGKRCLSRLTFEHKHFAELKFEVMKRQVFDWCVFLK